MGNWIHENWGRGRLVALVLPPLPAACPGACWHPHLGRAHVLTLVIFLKESITNDVAGEQPGVCARPLLVLPTATAIATELPLLRCRVCGLTQGTATISMTRMQRRMAQHRGRQRTPPLPPRPPPLPRPLPILSFRKWVQLLPIFRRPNPPLLQVLALESAASWATLARPWCSSVQWR